MKKYLFSLMLMTTALAVHPNNLVSTPPGYSNIESGSMLLPLATTETEGDEPIAITPNQVGPSTYGRQVILKQVNNYYGLIHDMEGEQCLAYPTYDPLLPAVMCWGFDISGVVERYQYWDIYDNEETVFYLAVTDILAMHYAYNDTADIKRINTLFNLENEVYGGGFDLTGHFTTPLTAVYQQDQCLYVRDIYGDYGLVYGYIPCVTTNGDIIHDAKAKPYNLNGIKVIHPEVPSSFIPDGHQTPVSPDVFTINNLGKNMIHHYLRFNGVEINLDDDGGFQDIADHTGTLPIDNKFGIEITESNNERCDLNGDDEVNIGDINMLINRILSGEVIAETTIDDEGYDVTGFLTIMGAGLALIPIKMVHHVDSSLVGDINDDGEVNIADINSIIDFILCQ